MLTDVAAGTTIFFTDNGFRNDTNVFRTNENVVRWVAQSNLTAGTVITFTAPNGTGAANTPEWTGIIPSSGAAAANAAFNLNTGGDNITALINPTFGGASLLTGTAIAQILWGAAAFPASYTSSSTDNATTALAPGLTVGVNAVAVGPIDNARYNDAAPGAVETGTAAVVAASLNNSANWSTSNDPLSPHNTTATFSITPTYNFIYATTHAGQTLTGTGANDWVYAGNGNDTIATGAAADRVYAGSGDDIIRGGTGADILYAEGGNDTADYSDATGAVFVDIAARFANETALTVGTVSGATAVVSMDTLISFENVTGSAFGDRLYGTTGDNLFQTGAGSDIVYGLDGSDTISYAAAAGAVFVDLQARFGIETALTTGTVNGGTVAVSTDTLISLENARGSAFGDRLYGTSEANQIFGEGGDDFIYGLGGNDTIVGGASNDRLVGGDGIDLLTGGEGADLFYFVGTEIGGADVIADFVSGTDFVYLSLSNFNGAAAFFAGTGSTDAIFGAHTAAGLAYDTANNALYYDADGSGAGSAIAIASFTAPVGGVTSADVVFY